ncbi:hypothetical protein ABPG75_012226 [Micractinium tetrahymenae]
MGDAVAATVLAQFAALPKTGKPQPHEHTVLAGIVLSLPAASSSGQPAAPQRLQQRGQQQAGAAGPQQAGQGASQLAVVALGTGTKCLGACKRLPGGVALNDCHAEVLCRRALLRWVYAELAEVVGRYQQAALAAAATSGASGGAGAGTDSATAVDMAALAAAASTRVLRLVPPAARQGSTATGSGAGGCSDPFGGWRFELKPGVQLHMYVSQPPCGDASILGVPACRPTESGAGERVGAGGGSGASAAGTFGRTGAKPLKRQRLEPACGDPAASPDEQPSNQLATQPAPAQSAGTEQLPERQQQQQQQQQQQLPEKPAQPSPLGEQQWRLPQQHEVESYGEAQATGLVRRKPGRGDATLSMSCSDKLARWGLLGLQGSLLSGLLAAPLHLASLTVSLQPAAPVPKAAAATAAPAPAEQQPGPQVAHDSTAELATGAAAALRRALVGRTAALAGERLQGGSDHPAEPSLHIHVPDAAAAAAAGAAAAATGATGGSQTSAPAATGSSSSSGGSGGGVQSMQELGLAPSATRRVGSGASIVWCAPPSTAFNWKEARRQQAVPPQQAGSGASNDASAQAASGAPVAFLGGGTVEAVAGTTGLQVGAAKTKPGQAVHPSAQSAVCKAALFAAWHQLAAALRQAPVGQPSCAPTAAPAQAPAAPALTAGMTYRQAKQAAGAGYAAAWRRLQEPPSLFEGWIPKPPALEEFTLDR